MLDLDHFLCFRYFENMVGLLFRGFNHRGEIWWAKICFRKADPGRFFVDLQHMIKMSPIRFRMAHNSPDTRTFFTSTTQVRCGRELNWMLYKQSQKVFWSLSSPYIRPEFGGSKSAVPETLVRRRLSRKNLTSRLWWTYREVTAQERNHLPSFHIAVERDVYFDKEAMGKPYRAPHNH